MHYIYIIYSPPHDKYYIGQTTNFKTRLFQHNNSTRNTFTSRYRPWIQAALFEVRTGELTVNQVERYLKKQKSKVHIKELIKPNFELKGVLVQLVRVPTHRD